MKGESKKDIDKDIMLKVEDEEGNEVELDVRKEIDKVVEIVKNLKDTAIKMKGAKVKVTGWSLVVSYNEGEYIVDFNMKLSVKPEKM